MSDVTFTDGRQCRVASGSWTDPYTSEMTEHPSDLDVDHLVPLANAHQSGGHAWNEDRKARFANHLLFAGHLVATTASANRTKGKKSPEDWRPPDRTYWCQYAVDWIAVKREWALTATEAEVDALREMLVTCEHASILQITQAEPSLESTTTATPASTQPTVEPSSNATPSPTSAVSADASPTPAPESTPDGSERNCSDFERWEDAQKFYEAAGGPDADANGLDKDGNGVACESLPGGPADLPVPIPSPTSAVSVDALPTPAPESTPDGPDRNCSDFERWEDAQKFYEAAGGPDADPHRLDRDRNGLACESLPGGPA